MKTYKEMSDDVFCRINEYNENKKKKNKIITRTLVPIASFCLVALLCFGIGNNDWISFTKSPTDIGSSVIEDVQSEKKGEKGNKPYPYEDKAEYINKKIPTTKFDNSFFAYNQIEEIDDTILSIYGALYDGSKLHRNCIPQFSDDGSVSFSRKSYPPDTDEVVFAYIKNYLGEQNSLLEALSSLPQNRNKSLLCSIIQNGTNRTATAIGADLQIYENCQLDVIVSNDFNSINNEKVKNHINRIKGIINSDTVSLINDKKASVCYVYQTRYCGEKDIDEGRYIYYAFYEKDNKEYLVQFTSNYTVGETNEDAFGIPQRSQEMCKSAFEDIIRILFSK